MKLVRPILAALALAIVAACSGMPTEPTIEPDLGLIGSGNSTSPSDAGRGLIGSGN